MAKTIKRDLAGNVLEEINVRRIHSLTPNHFATDLIMRATAPLLSRLRRLSITTKQVGKGFYKGTGSGAMGWHTKHGGYKIDPKKVRTYVVPERLKDCKVRQEIN